MDFERPTAPMVDLGTYKFKYLSQVKISPEEQFMNAYMEEVYLSF